MPEAHADGEAPAQHVVQPGVGAAVAGLSQRDVEGRGDHRRIPIQQVLHIGEQLRLAAAHVPGITAFQVEIGHRADGVVEHVRPLQGQVVALVVEAIADVARWTGRG